MSGLKDGMTISFHHHFRGGDKVVNLVVDKLADMGYKNLHLAASSLSDVHAPLLRHIKSGVVTRISTSGLRGELAQAISEGHNGRACYLPQPWRTRRGNRQRRSSHRCRLSGSVIV